MAAMDESADGRHLTSAVEVAPVSARPGSRVGVGIAVVGGIALLLASAGLFLVSRGKWSDAIIDSGREWIVPDALARGELLYRDVVYWFGPFTPYLHAGFFRLFGSSFATLVLAGVVGSVGVLAALFFALRTVTERREAALWTALAVPALLLRSPAVASTLSLERPQGVADQGHRSRSSLDGVDVYRWEDEGGARRMPARYGNREPGHAAQ